ncbi:hypothetical protein GCM10020218_087350 [Dactylosporangium vinaceum]|uniref:WD40 repeat domain-containing protein n=1 Tax=Dactylosporangium vinaceum TaxID=53362 RepID=A0ABV5MFB4_9ACTN|nr:hypothetical protein [Dactylosporangium vinaceum]
MPSVERLIAHPRLPLVAGLEAAGPAVHVWDCADGAPRRSGGIERRGEPYDDEAAFGWDRRERTPAVAWHPTDPVLVVATAEDLVQWTPETVAPLPVPTGARLPAIAFAPGGRALWTPAGRLDLDTGDLREGPEWDTGLAVHPAGRVAAALRSDQGATLVLFTPFDAGQLHMRILNQALILAADGYQTPVFNADGRLLAVRGNNYEHSVDVFAFPSLRKVLATRLDGPDEYWDWSMHNLAFGAHPGVLYAGTPAGTVIAIDVERRAAAEHPALDGSPVTALAALATGGLVVAGAGGELRLFGEAAGETRPDAEAATTLLGGTAPMPDDADEPEYLTDGVRSWGPGDLETVTEAEPTDPSWLRIAARMNGLRSGADATD